VHVSFLQSLDLQQTLTESQVSVALLLVLFPHEANDIATIVANKNNNFFICF
jgi:hypothetical protein